MSWSRASFAAIDVGTVGSRGVLGDFMAVVKEAVDERKGRKERRRGSIG